MPATLNNDAAIVGTIVAALLLAIVALAFIYIYLRHRAAQQSSKDFEQTGARSTTTIFGTPNTKPNDAHSYHYTKYAPRSQSRSPSASPTFNRIIHHHSSADSFSNFHPLPPLPTVDLGTMPSFTQNKPGLSVSTPVLKQPSSPTSLPPVYVP